MSSRHRAPSTHRPTRRSVRSPELRRPRSARPIPRPSSARRLFAVYAAVSLVPVLILAAMLNQLMNRQADARGLAQGQAQASVIARVTLAPLLGSADLRGGLTTTESQAVETSVRLAVRDGDVLRLRLRDLDGRIVYADDGSTGAPDPEAVEAGEGTPITELTYLNADIGDQGQRGPRVVEAYQPIRSSITGERIGVLEIYLPYAPIAASIARTQRVLTITITAGLALLWLSLSLVSMSVTRRLRRQVRLNSFLAPHDVLTSLPNRSAFIGSADAAIGAATERSQVAIALIDLDRFKEVNDTLGHATGDTLLVTLANRLTEQLRATDTVARLGGDEFALVLPGLHGPGEAIELLTRLRSILHQPLLINGLPLAAQTSVGFAVAPDDGVDADLLLQRAELAMYTAKAQHLGIAHYRPGYETSDSATLSLMAELGAAIEAGQLRLHYQPKGDIRTGQVTSVEALVRWQHPTRGLLYPDAFIPAAEQTELIDPLTTWVLRAATAAVAQLDPSGPLAVAVNISARSLVRADFADQVLAVLADTGIAAERVILELTESALLVDPDQAGRTLRRLCQAGFRVSIDDFGVGQTSLGYLATLPISELKIDKSFVLSMDTDPRNAAIVRSVIELGHGLGCVVTAEGVETSSSLAQLTRYGCDTAQGYLLARPTPPSELESRVHEANGILDANRDAVSASRSM